MPMPVVDVSGVRFGSLVVVRRGKPGRGRQITWICRCDCGRDRVVLGGELRRGKVTSCGCMRSKNCKSREALRRKNAVGMTFGLLRCVAVSSFRKVRSELRYECLCEGCGRIVSIRATNLLAGLSTSCGCARGGITSALKSMYTGSPIGIIRDTVRNRVVVCGWSLHEALNTPVQRKAPDTLEDLDLRSDRGT